MGRFSNIVTPDGHAPQTGPQAPIAAPDIMPPMHAGSVPPPHPVPQKIKPKVQREKNEALQTRRRLHNMLIDNLDLSILDQLDEGEMRAQIEARISEIVKLENMKLNRDEVQALSGSIANEMTGLDPLEPLLADGSRVNVAVAPIAVDGPLMSIRKFSKNPFSLDKLGVVPVLFRMVHNIGGKQQNIVFW